MDQQCKALVICFLEHLRIYWNPSALLDQLKIYLQELQVVEQVPDFVFHL